MPDLIPLSRIAPSDIEALLDLAFGPGRHARTAYRVRMGTVPIASLSFAAIEGDVLVGSIQCWPVELCAGDGATAPLIMVGPVAVDPDRQGTGIGRALMARSIAAAGADAPLMLIGDPEYYGQFGFTADRTGGWSLPGPYEQRRLLAMGDVPASAGMVGPRITIAA